MNGTTTLYVDDESFGSILLIEGNATIENDGTTLEVNKGDSVFIDANSGDVKIQGTANGYIAGFIPCLFFSYERISKRFNRLVY